MEVTLAGWLLAVLAVAALGLLFWGVLVLVRTCQPWRPWSECLLASCVLVFLLINGEVLLLSWMPGERPLDWLPLLHLVLTGLLLVAPLPWHGWRIHTAVWRGLIGDCPAWFRAAGRVPAIGAALLVPLFVVYLLFGAYNVPMLWDDLNYHVPMAIQPYQDGRLGEVTDDRPQARYFPRGVETCWYWTLQFTHTDLLFHPTQLALGIQLMLGSYVLARRTGAAPGAAAVAAIVIATTPIFYLLATKGYVDLAVAAAVVALLAWLAPASDPTTARPHSDWLWAALAFAQAGLVKFPLPALLVAAAGLTYTLALRWPIQEGLRRAAGFAFSLRGLVSAAVIVTACQTYIENWRCTGNPVYPFAVTLAGRTILPGPHTANATNFGGETTAQKPIAEMSRSELYYRAWTDLETPLTIESFGSFGPVLPFGLLLPAAVFMLTAILARQRWNLALSAAIGLCLVLTPAAVPRYGLPVVALITVAGVCVLSQLPGRYAGAAAAAVLLLCVPGVTRSLRDLAWWLRLHHAEAGFSLLRRNYYFHEQYETGSRWFASIETTRYLRAHGGPGDLLIWNVRTFPTLLRNRDWTNRVRHLPGSPREVYPGKVQDLPEITRAELTAWLEEVRRSAPRFILVYRGSAYAEHLRADPEFGYTVAHEDPAARPYPMVLFERAGGGVLPASTRASAPVAPAE
jgi:hypothetical protein